MEETRASGRRRPPDWDAIRAEYEGRLFHPALICERHGITTAQLRYRREQEDWISMKASPPRKADLVARMLRVLNAQIRELERAKDMPIDKKAKVLAEEVRTLDKLIEMGAAQRNVEPPTRKDMTDLRAKLVKRLEQSAR
ncbi:hypothetical protein O9Z70_03725 [Devosia sp. YIM 151766]|uniref:hypothetical protein n=1 Tax=Devosia sp. YIM 151766 TaxID=3017325 RepID=UPI00255CF871|nr:hypothetical protein [Devosia sp. YIM 151766]WIY53660.1 hypothetical protein O9Z70_03725 [Devosia sp. YIM 151766]